MAATGVFVIPALPYLQAIGFEKDELVQALGLHFTVSTVALALVLWDGGAFDVSLGTLSLFAIVPALVGMYAGQRMRARISADTFRVFLLCRIAGARRAAGGAEFDLGRHDARNGFASVSSVDAEIGIGRQQRWIGRDFGHSHQTRIGEAHRNVSIFFHQGKNLVHAEVAHAGAREAAITYERGQQRHSG